MSWPYKRVALARSFVGSARCGAPRSWTNTSMSGFSLTSVPVHPAWSRWMCVSRIWRTSAIAIPLRSSVRSERRQAGRRSGIDQRHAARPMEHGCRDDVRVTEKVEVDVVDARSEPDHWSVLSDRPPRRLERRDLTGACRGPCGKIGSSSMAGTDRQTDGELLERTRQETKKPELYKVLLLNDDYTTMDFVVEVLENVFHKPPAEAFRIMMTVHTQGKGLCGRVPVRGRGNEGRDRRRAARASTASRCAPQWNRSKGCSATFSPVTRSRSHRRLSRGDRAASHAPDARAPALRARARPRRRADPRRLRRRSAAAAPRSRQVPEGVQSSSSRAASRRSRSRRWRSAACCRPRCCTCRAPAGRKCSPATCSRRRCSRPSRTRRSCSPAQGVTRLDVLEYITHGISKVPPSTGSAPRRRRRRPATPKPGTASAAARRPAIRSSPTR